MAKGLPGPATEPGAVAAPPELQAFPVAWRTAGSGTLRFFGFKVYDASLWLSSPTGSFDFNNAFALDIRYDTGVKGSDIVNTSLIEMTRISGGSADQVAAWNGFMKGMFRDVKAGDRLLGVHLPASGARFFLNGKLIGESADVAFSEAFFKIWLDPKTSRPELRVSLLGLDDSARRIPGVRP